jgi:hypothetical protein
VETAAWLLLSLGILGGLDVVLFHVISHGLRRHAGSRKELIFHALRGPTYALLFIAVPNFRLEGAWFAGLVGLLGIDLAISIGDFLVEGESRRDLGGLPSGEYLLHALMAVLFGALTATLLILEGDRLKLPTALLWESAGVPPYLRLVLGVMAVGVLASGLLDLRAVLKFHRR